jgi:hypothetical protein
MIEISSKYVINIKPTYPWTYSNLLHQKKRPNWVVLAFIIPSVSWLLHKTKFDLLLYSTTTTMQKFIQPLIHFGISLFY